MTVRALAAAALVGLIAMASPAAAAPNGDAKAHVDRAKKAHQSGDYALALEELTAAYALDPKPELLFAFAQVHSKLGQCAEAIDYYERFLATVTEPQIQTVVREAIAACRAQLESAKPEPEPVVTPPVVAPTPTPTPPVPPRAWYRDRLGQTFAVAGTIALVGGLVTYGSARGSLDDAEAAGSLAQYEDLVDRAHGRRTLAVVLVGGGTLLVGAAAWRFVTNRDPAVQIGVVPARGGGAVGLAGRF